MENKTTGKKIRLMLVDDHMVLRMGLVTATNGEPDMEVVAEADNGDEALAAYRRSSPDVVIMDLRMPKRGGLEGMQLLRTEFPAARILVFSNYASGEEVFEAFRAGAAGFVSKDMPLERLLDAVRVVHSGEQYLLPEIARKMNGRVLTNLSAREIEVLKLVARGLSNKEIGSALNVVEGTVKVHLTSILAKLEVSDRTQAILTAVKRGIIQLE